VGILHAAKSKSVRTWKALDSRITDAANEAKDNVKYLYTLDKFFGPLSKCTPQGERLFQPDHDHMLLRVETNDIQGVSQLLKQSGSF